MQLNPGTKLGPYEILAPLGAGGMGEVYRARDTRLGREVAIKVLPTHLHEQPEVRTRFEREAKTISALNHPHICTLFDVGREGGIDFLVMELIDGETLAARLTKGALPAADVLRIGSEVADALDRAHRAGIVHRDLKPGNIMLTRSGAKLMDFGLARVTGLAGGNGSGVTMAALTQSPTQAQPLTAEGTIVGTFQYMSPEQLEGKEADERADIWALGCVLYEMSTGRRPFEGGSQASLITSIMGSHPAPISQVTPMSPPALDRLVAACLAKDPAERVQSAHDVKLQLAWMAEGGSDIAMPKVVAKRRRNRAALLWALALIPAVVAGALIRDAVRGKGGAESVVRSALLPPAGTRLETTGDDSGPPAISPDGSMVVFCAVGGGGGKRLWLRRLDSYDARPLTGTDEASYPFWSPDSRSIGFFTPGAVRRFDVEEGTVVTVAPVLYNARGGAWSSEDVILFSPSFRSGLSRVAASGGDVTAVTVLDTTRESTHRFPYFMPDGKHFIYLSAMHTDADGRSSGVYFASIDGGEAKRVLTCRSNAIYSDGFLFFVQDSTLMAQAFDPDTGEVEGAPRATRETVQIDGSTWRMPATVSDNGTLVYALSKGTGNTRLTLFERSGSVVKHLTGFGNLLNVRFGDDGRRVAYELQILPLADIWVVDCATGTRTRITTSPEDETIPVFAPDGRYVLYAAKREDAPYAIYRMRADGSGSEALVFAAEKDVWPLSIARDGRWLVYGHGVASGTPAGSLNVVPLTGDRTPRVLVPESDGFLNAALSPDERWLAFSATVSGRLEVYVSPFRPESDGTPARWQISSRGGDRPRWTGSGRELCYTRPDGTIVAVKVDGAGADFRVDGEKDLFQVFQRINISTMDVSPDGQYFVINQLGGSSIEPLAIVTHWTSTLKDR